MSEFRRKLMMAYAANLGRDNIIYPGLIAAWSAKGKTNDDKDRAILKDLTGNGHDITLNGFAFSEMSGYGGYVYNFKNLLQWISSNVTSVGSNTGRAEGTVTASLCNIVKVLTSGNFLERNGAGYSSFAIKVSGLTDEITLSFLSPANPSEEIIISSDGIYNLGKGDNEYKYHGFRLKNSTNTFPFECNITIELLPEYPDALVFDGVDDWGISKSLPILTDYTIIVKRVFLDNEKGYSGTIAAKGVNPENLGAFCFERNYNTYFSQNSFGGGSRIKIDKNVEISWQTTLSYLGKAIQRGGSLDEPTFTIGTSFSRYYFLKGAIYSAYLFDRSLDEQEIKSFIRKYIDPEYLLPSEIPTPPPISAR